MAGTPFPWSDYLVLADELAERTQESALRSAISRAYYYTYHLALARARTNLYRAERGESTHAQLWRLYSGCPEPIAQRMAVIAERLKEKRERADYENTYLRIAEDVPIQLEEARKFAALLNSLPARHPSPGSTRR